MERSVRNLTTPGYFLAAICLAVAGPWPGGGAGLSSRGAELPDVRRDAVVLAVEKAMPSVVNIATETIVERRDPFDEWLNQFYGYRRMPPTEKRYSLGSGVIIDEEGFVLTNDHVVRRANKVWVKLTAEAGGGEYEADVITGTQQSDVALLKIRAKPGEKFAPIRFAADDDLLLGETVIALGNPFGLGGSVSRGILSSKTRRPPMENQPLDVLDWLQTDAAINPGNSGGPLVNLRGELIGMNVAVLGQGQGIGFAIPIKRVAEALSERLTPEALKSVWFGARVKPSGVPLVVTSVQTDSPAAKAGLKEGDLVLRVNGKPARTFIEFSRELVRMDDKKPLQLQVRRGQETRDITVQMVPENTVFNSGLIQKKTGLALQQLTSDLARSLQVYDIGGFIVAGVEAKSPAAEAGFQRYHIVRAVDGQSPPDMVALAKLLSEKKTGDTVKLAVVRVVRNGILSGDVELKVR
ncbi:MAG: trypsin-like peptidase domain-containing protein [Verrucomicrobiota bacterium]